MSILTHPLRHAALATITTGACSLSLLAIAQAGTVGNPPAVHKRLQREPYFGHLSGVAAAWVSAPMFGGNAVNAASHPTK